MNASAPSEAPQVESLAERNLGGSPHLNGAVAPGLARVFPPLTWLRHYDSGWLAADSVAGVTLAAYAIPVSLAYATLAGLPPHYGVYCSTEALHRG
jgi:hypothetical protein